MKKTILFTLLALVSLVSVGCSASGRVSVDRNSATMRPGDAQVAYITKPAPVVSDRK